MGTAIPLAVLAGIFAAVSSTCQRRGAARAPGDDRFSATLVLRLLRDRLWLLGVASMILAFACQAVALHFGSLALVQPILASEMLYVFGFVALVSRRRIRAADLRAAVAMAFGLGMFLLTADPHGGRPSAPGQLWILAAVAGAGLVAVLVAAAVTPLGRGQRPSGGRRAALLGAASGVTWGYLAAVIKELGSHASQGAVAMLSNWSLYVLIGVGIVSMVLASNALRAGPLAASQPGFTIVDPLVASLLGVLIFRDRLHAGPLDLAIEALALLVLLSGVVSLSHSSAVHGDLPPGVDPFVAGREAAAAEAAAEQRGEPVRPSGPPFS